MNPPATLPASRRAFSRALLSYLLAVGGVGATSAQTIVTWTGTTSAVWNVNGNWNTNFPNSSTKTAQFGSSSRTSVTASSNVALDKLLFTSAAPAYTLTVSRNFNLSGSGIENQSSALQTITTSSNNGYLTLSGNATITGAVKLTNANNNTGNIYFTENSSAGGAQLVLKSAGNAFQGNATAGNATITINQVGVLNFEGTSSAGNSTITVNLGGSIYFWDSSTAAGATIVVNELGGGPDLSMMTASSLSIGSLASASTVSLGSRNLSVGALNTSTTISGQIVDGGFGGGTGGSLTKVGSGTLTLSGNNTYTGGTTISFGTVNTGHVSAFGTGSIAIRGPNAILNLSGQTIANAIAVDTGGKVTGDGGGGTLTVGSGGTVAPGATIGSLAFGATTWAGNSTFTFQLNNASGTAGTNWDQLSVTGALTLSATSQNKITLAINTLDFTSGNPGAASNFNAATNYSFAFATASGGISGFDPNAFIITTSGVSNTLGGAWSVGQTDNSLNLIYTGTASPIPEPGAYALFTSVGALGFVAWRRQRTCAIRDREKRTR